MSQFLPPPQQSDYTHPQTYYPPQQPLPMPGMQPYPPQPNYPPPQKPISDWAFALRAGIIILTLLTGGGLFAGFLHQSHNTISSRAFLHHHL